MAYVGVLALVVAEGRTDVVLRRRASGYWRSSWDGRTDVLVCVRRRARFVVGTGASTAGGRPRAL